MNMVAVVKTCARWIWSSLKKSWRLKRVGIQNITR